MACYLAQVSGCFIQFISLATKNFLSGFEKCGYLVKEGGSTVRNWRKRWFVLKGNSIYYSKTPEDSTPLGTIYLEDIRTVEPTNEKPSQNFVFSLKGQDNSRTWYLSAASQEEMNSWMDIIKRCLNHSNTPQHNSIPANYVTVECSNTRGIRINGNVPPQLLATVSHGVSYEKKKRDERGWYCDKHVPICLMLNLFQAYGWELEVCYESTFQTPNEKDANVSVNIAIFSKKFKKSTVPKPTVAPKPVKKETTIEEPKRKTMASFFADDDEMVSLMKEMGLEDLIT